MDIERRHYFNNQPLIKTYGCRASKDHEDGCLDDRDITGMDYYGMNSDRELEIGKQMERHI